MAHPPRGRLVAFGIIGALALLVVAGKAVTGRATGGEVDPQAGCGGDPTDSSDPTGPVSTRESALCPVDDPFCGPIDLECQWNGYKDWNESDIDCGGNSECPRCAVGKRCTKNTDCTTGYCSSQRCTLKPDFQSCTSNSQCASGICGKETYCNPDTCGNYICQSGECKCGSYSVYRCLPIVQPGGTCTSPRWMGSTVDKSGNKTPPVCYANKPGACGGGGPIESASLSGNCYYFGGANWCTDYYRNRQCTGAWSASCFTNPVGWDLTYCNWSGWKYLNSTAGWVWCSGGWQCSNSTHKHCD